MMKFLEHFGESGPEKCRFKTTAFSCHQGTSAKGETCPMHPDFRSVRVVGSEPMALDDRLI
jgi:hypothetical protein